jgi:membrane fusion protein (multidrug efflux system)
LTVRGRTRFRSGIVLAVVLLALAACQRSKPPDAPATGASAPPPAVVVAAAVQQTVPISREFVARTDAVQTVEIKARVAGVLEQVLFREGTEVKQGQVLFVIERGQYEALVQSARAQLSKAQADLTRAREQVEILRAQAQLEQQRAALGKTQQDVARLRPLAQEQAVPQQDLDTAIAAERYAAAQVTGAEAALKDSQLSQRVGLQQAQAAVEGARAALTQAELNLGYTTIQAPLSGMIGFLAVTKGNLVGQGQPTTLTTMSSVDPMKVIFNASELDFLAFSKERPEAKAEAKIPPLELILADNSVYPQRGRVLGMNRTLDPKTGTILIEGLFPNPGKMLRPGQFGRVRADIGQHPDAVLVPQRAVQELQGAKTVLVVGPDNKVAVRTISVGDRYRNSVIVLSGLTAGERVIVEGIQKARPGMPVTPATQPLTPEKP